GAGAGAVFNDELLTEPLRQPLSHQPRENVRRSAGCKTNDQVHRARWVILRLCKTRDDWKRGSTRCQMQKGPTGKLHGVTPEMPAPTLIELSVNLKTAKRLEFNIRDT